MAVVLDHLLEDELQMVRTRITIMPGNKVQAPAARGVILATTQALALHGAIPIRTVRGIIQVQEVRGVTLHLVIHHLGVRAVVADSLAVADFQVVVAAIVAVVDTEDDKIIRSASTQF
jgi:hypothetical protein